MLAILFCRGNALGSLFEVSENALMGHQDRIAGLATTVVGDVSGLLLGVPQCDLKRWIPQDDALQISHAGASAALGERPSKVIPEIVAVAHLAGNVTGDHFDQAGFFKIVLGCCSTALCIPIETRDQFVEPPIKPPILVHGFASRFCPSLSPSAFEQAIIIGIANGCF